MCRYKKNILYFSGAVDMGGAEHSISLLMRFLDIYKYKPILICKEDGELPRKLRKYDITIKYVKLFKLLSKNPFRLLINIFGLFISLIKIKLLIKDFDPVIMHSNSSRMHILVALAGRVFNVPAVCHLREVPLNAIQSFFIRIFFYFTNPFIIASSMTLVKAYNLKNYKRVRIIPNGFIIPLVSKDAKTRLIRRWKIQEDYKIFINIGRLEPKKGQIYVLKAFKEFIKSNPKIYLFIVGGNLFSMDNSYKNKIFSMAKIPELINNVVTTDHVTNPNDYIAISDVLIQSSIKQEAFGRVIVEAMALKKPVISSNIGGPTEIISHGFNGLLCDIRNTSEFIKYMELLINDIELYKRISINGFETVKKKYLIENHTENVMSYYDFIVNKN